MLSGRKHIFVTGSVGVGKSHSISDTIYQSTSLGLNVFYVKEYIDYDPYGINQYDNWINDRISLIEFQKYICNLFREQLKTPAYMMSKLVVWERHPREALLVFSQSGLSDDEYEELDNMITELEEDFEIPKLSINKLPCYGFNMQFASTKMIASFIISTFTNMIINNDNCFFIYLYYTHSGLGQQLNNIKRRGRIEEIQRYSFIQNLIDINDLYTIFTHKYLSIKSH